MLHHFMTAELVRQRQAALAAEARTARLVRQVQPGARTDPEGGGPGAATGDPARSTLCGTWTIDPAHSVVSFARGTLRRSTITARRHGLGVVHLDELPPVGVIGFQQRSGLPVLTMVLDAAGPETGAGDLNAVLGGPDAGAARQRWWTLHSQSLEILPGGVWRVMATLTAHRTLGLVELRLEVDPERRHRDWLVLRGRGALDRRAFATGTRPWSLDPTIRLELAVHARRVETVRGAVSGMSAPEQDRVSAQLDARPVPTTAGRRHDEQHPV